jgi:hypothetical protein
MQGHSFCNAVRYSFEESRYGFAKEFEIKEWDQRNVDGVFVWLTVKHVLPVANIRLNFNTRNKLCCIFLQLHSSPLSKIRF